MHPQLTRLLALAGCALLGCADERVAVSDVRPAARYATLETEPAPQFELVSGFGEIPAPCDELTAWVRFNAPARRGVVEGVLRWEVSDGEFQGLAEIALRGLVR